MERSAADFLTELAGLGPEIHVVTQTSAWHYPGVVVHALGVSGWSDATQYRRFVGRAHQFLAGEAWDIRHAIRPCLACDVYQPRGGIVKAGQERNVATRRNGMARLFRQATLFFNAKERVLASLEHRLLTGSSQPKVVVPSDYVRRQVEERYPVPEDNIRRIFNGVRVTAPEDAERDRIRRQLRESLALAQDRLIAIFVGHNFRRKGLTRMIECLRLPAAAAWSLLIVGRGATGSYRRQAKQLGLQDRVQFLGSRTDVRNLYCASDACVLPTYNDPCSRTILEALSLGVPCVTTAYDGSSECIQDGEHGFVVDSPQNVDALANALHKLSDAETRRYMAGQARSLGAFLSMRRHAVEMLQVYGEIIMRRSPRRAAGSR
jgi:UDP-glucose:(heptosyl)LPS alpha-1,3-glucosyltransferase